MKYINDADKKNIRKLTFIFSLFVLGVLIAVLGLSSLATYIFYLAGIITSDGISTPQLLLFIATTSVVMGAIISIITMNFCE